MEKIESTKNDHNCKVAFISSVGNIYIKCRQYPLPLPGMTQGMIFNDMLDELKYIKCPHFKKKNLNDQIYRIAENSERTFEKKVSCHHYLLGHLSKALTCLRKVVSLCFRLFG